MENPMVVHEAYAFVCMSCGRGWERVYEIHHATDLHGDRLYLYYSEGTRVPSPFTAPTCEHCDGTRLRILPAGRVASMTPPPTPRVDKVGKADKAAKPAKPTKPAKVPTPRSTTRWHLPSLHRPA
jgi:hypothetical protein